MAHYGMLRDYRFSEDVDDVRGATVYGLEDEKIGKIDDVIFDHSTGQIRYVVVDSGGWLKSKKFLVPADRIFPHSKNPEDFVVGVTKQQIESFPPYDEKNLESEERWTKYEREFKERWTDSPVLHQKDSDRIITPPEEPVSSGMESGSASKGAGSRSGSEDYVADLTPHRIVDKFSDPTPSGAKVTLRPAGTPSRAEDAAYGTRPLSSRWSEFEALLRVNRVDISAKCAQCAPALDEDRDVA